MKKVKLNDVVTLEYKDPSVEALYTNEFDNNGQKIKRTSAHLTQERIVTYPARNMGTGHGTGLFENPDGKSYPSTRHCLVAVPNDATAEVVAAQIAKFTECMVYRIVSNDVYDVMGDKYKNALENGQTDLETVKARLLVQDAEGNIYANYTTDGAELVEDAKVVGSILKDENGKTIGFNITNENALLEYKADVFSREFTPDVDKRKFIKKGTTQEVVKENATADLEA